MLTLTQLILGCTALSLALVMIVTYLKRQERFAKIPTISTRWPLLGNAPGLDMSRIHIVLADWAQKVGPVFRIRIYSEEILVLNDYRSIHDALVTKGSAFAGRPPMYRTSQDDRHLHSIVWQTYNEKLKFLRKEVVRGLKMYGNGLDNLEQRCVPEILTMLDEIGAHGSDHSFDPWEHIYDAVANVMLGLTLDKRYDHNTDSFRTIKNVNHLFNDSFGSGQARTMDYLPFLSGLRCRGQSKQLRDALELRDRFWESEYRDIQGRTDADCVVQKLLATIEDPKNAALNVSENTVKECFTNLILAGTDTTATALTCLLLVFLHYPDIQERMWNELKGKLQLGQDELSHDGENELGQDELDHHELGQDELGKDRLGRDELGQDELGHHKLCQDELGQDSKQLNCEQDQHEQSRNLPTQDSICKCQKLGQQNQPIPNKDRSTRDLRKMCTREELGQMKGQQLSRCGQSQQRQSKDLSPLDSICKCKKLGRQTQPRQKQNQSFLGSKSNVLSSRGQGRLARLSDLPELPFCHAVLLELLRYISHVSLAVPHYTLCDTEVLGIPVPRDMTVYINLWALHHNPKDWPDPWTFRPQRFLDDNGCLLPIGHPVRRKLMAFGAGRRVCLGETLARNRLFLFASALVQQFQFLPCPEDVESGRLPPLDPRTYDMGLVIHPKRFKLQAVPRAY